MSDTIMPIVTSILLAVNVDEKSTAVVHAVQSDHLSRIIRAGFTDEFIIYAIDTDAKVSFVVIRPDGIMIEKDCEVDSSGQYVEVTLDENILQAYGNARANFIIRDVDAEQSMRSQEFTLHIGEKLDKEEAIPTDAPVPIAQQVRKNTEAITDLSKRFDQSGGGGNGVTKEELSDIQTELSAIKAEIETIPTLSNLDRVHLDDNLNPMQNGYRPVFQRNGGEELWADVSGEILAIEMLKNNGASTGKGLTEAQIDALHGLAICLRDAGCTEEYTAFYNAFYVDVPDVPDDPVVPDTPTGNAVSLAWSGTTAKISNLNSTTITWSGTTARIGA
ncbi:MAG: BppU family phage baseplate upper protein [Lachnospiraceae bacterium]|nr:BppU family phage baseplate upper protein [Lachnospiraceae bacterium]